MGMSSVLSGFTLRKLPVRLRVVKLGLRFNRDESPSSDDGPDSGPTRRLSDRLTFVDTPARVLSGVIVGSLLLGSAVTVILVPILKEKQNVSISVKLGVKWVFGT